MKAGKKTSVRLTTDVLPLRYEIGLKPDLEAFIFEGEETIHLSLKKPTKTITLHAIELAITSAQVGDVATERISYDRKAETATFHFKKPLSRGKAQLRLRFSGTLNDKMHGFYRSSYMHEGKRKYLATTQFESTDARRAFPCFDEPAMKAVFDVSLTVPQGLVAISNTIVVGTQAHADGTTTAYFAPTPKMSTYLLAFIVGEFEYIEKKSKDGVLVRVFATPGKKEQLTFALDCAAKIIAFFNHYFAIPYPLPILQMVAIPDFSAGAMENWGAITYRESALLVDQKHSSTASKQWVALVIAHEIAHQWFGNLVTMEWWTHLWLNEGFASYIEYLAVDHLFPRWDMWTQFLQADTNVALHYDGLLHTHPVEVEVHHPSEITAVFDAVSYSKGASILRMLADYLGERDFRNGLRRYLKRHAYGNAETADLWDALEKTSDKPVGKIMKNWTGKPGYPLLTVTEKNGGFHIDQSRFFASPISGKRTHHDTLWHIPVSFEHGKKKGKELLRTRMYRIPSSDPRLKLNCGESSFFRTSYPASVQDELGKRVATKRLPTRDRLGLIRDIFALAENGTHSSVDGLKLARRYANETEYVVWAQVASGLGKIRSLIADEAFLKEYDAFALGVFSEIGKKVRWTTRPKDHSHVLLKSLVLEILGLYGDASVIACANKLFAAVCNGANVIPADLRSVVYNTIARYGGAREHAKLLAMYKAEALHEEKNRIGRALGLFKQKALLQKTLEFAVSKHVRSQDSVRMIGVVAHSPHGRRIAWRFVKKHWSVFLERYSGSREVSFLLEPFGTSTSASFAKEFGAFIKKHPAPGTERSVQQVLEHIHSNAAWLSRDRKQLQKFL